VKPACSPLFLVIGKIYSKNAVHARGVFNLHLSPEKVAERKLFLDTWREVTTAILQPENDVRSIDTVVQNDKAGIAFQPLLMQYRTMRKRVYSKGRGTTSF
jgi:hypothetical protein